MQVRPKSSDKRGSSVPKFGRVTKFKHLKGTPLHKSHRFENLKGLSKSTPAETDIVAANIARWALIGCSWSRDPRPHL